MVMRLKMGIAMAIKIRIKESNTLYNIQDTLDVMYGDRKSIYQIICHKG